MWPGSRSVRMSALGSALSWDGRVACGSRWRRHAGVELKQHIKPPPGFERQHAVSNLVDIVFPHHIAALRAEGNAHARKEQSEVVINLGRRRHRRAWVARGVLLPDGDRRSDAFDFVNVRLLHALQELP